MAKLLPQAGWIHSQERSNARSEVRLTAKPRLQFRNGVISFFSLFLVFASLVSCVQPNSTLQTSITQTPVVIVKPEATRTQIPPRPVYGPATLVDYVAQSGDSFLSLASHFNTTVAEIQEANPLILKTITTLAAGLKMKIPIYYESLWGSQFQIIPDYLFVNGPAQIGFNTSEFVDQQPGWLKGYTILAGGLDRRGGDLIDYVAQSFSISPRVLLMIAEYQTGALTQPVLDPEKETYPLGYEDLFHQGFYLQLVWAANQLNSGYYGWRNGRLDDITRSDGSIEVPDPWQNSATVALQTYYSQKLSLLDYEKAINEDGFLKTYKTYFGDPWQEADQALIPGNLQQPDFSLPFAKGRTWSFTGGPHAAWGSGEPLAALDFAPFADFSGCTISNEFVTAIADGQIVRTEPAVAVLDLNQDGDERTGWSVLYLHLGPTDMVRPGVLVKTGDPIGHPSCEGGDNVTGTHVHIARKYNGEWIDADSAIPFNLEGWIAKNGSEAYKGTLSRYGRVVTASERGGSESRIKAGTK
jgi:LasA protease